jgi:hypothetical protein
MDARIAQLESQIRRLSNELERLKSSVWLIQERQRPDWFARICLTLILANAVLFVAVVFH